MEGTWTLRMGATDKHEFTTTLENTLHYYADNLPILRNHIPDGSEMFGEAAIPLQRAAALMVCPTQKGALT